MAWSPYQQLIGPSGRLSKYNQEKGLTVKSIRFVLRAVWNNAVYLLWRCSDRLGLCFVHSGQLP